MKKVQHVEKNVVSPRPNAMPAPQSKVEMDKCVLCDKETEYPKNMHVDYRYNYVDGSGQLCRECADKIYKNSLRSQAPPF